MWKEHCQGYEYLFFSINNLITSYNKVCEFTSIPNLLQSLVSYDEMLEEICRRREFLKKREEKTLAFQKELDKDYEEEMRARDAFRQTAAIHLPPLCSALDVCSA